jgi:hypothetical protein
MIWGGGEELTEDELFYRRQHVQRECHFVLVAFALQESDQVAGVQHGGWMEWME